MLSSVFPIALGRLNVNLLEIINSQKKGIFIYIINQLFDLLHSFECLNMVFDFYLHYVKQVQVKKKKKELIFK